MFKTEVTDSEEVLGTDYEIQGSVETSTKPNFIQPTRSLAEHKAIIETSLSSFLVTGTLSTSTVFSTTR